MAELKRLIKAYDDQKVHIHTFALATVVEVEGSSYRRPGARMLISNDGKITGTISGGCLEGDALNRARYCMLHKKVDIIVYDSSDREEDLSFGAQLGCQGKIDIFITPVDALDPNNPLELFRSIIAQNCMVVLATVLASSNTDIASPGNHLFLSRRSVQQGFLTADEKLHERILHDITATLNTGISVNKVYTLKGASFRVFMEVIYPAPELTIFGAGNDVQPLSRLAASLGWKVKIRDGRIAQAKKERFPEAESIEVVKIGELEHQPPFTGYAVLMSHNYNYDLKVLEYLSTQDELIFTGILGPRKKTNFLLHDLTLLGLIDEVFSKKIHGPVGLNIGAETPDEISVSIMAQLLAIEKGQQGGFLSLLDRPIHDRGLAKTEIEITG